MIGYIGIKSYPRGVTTHSSSGIESYEPYYPVFKALEEEGMVLNLHGEVPSDDKAVSIFTSRNPATVTNIHGVLSNTII
jgi:dihydroorotase